MGDIYQKPETRSWTGDGKAATALKNELATGQMTKGKWHVLDVAELLSRFRDLLERNRMGKVSLTDDEVKISLSESQELWDALDSSDEAGAVSKYLEGNEQASAAVRTIVNKVSSAAAMKTVTGATFDEPVYNGVPQKPSRTSGPRVRTQGLIGSLGGITDALAIVDTVVQFSKGNISYCQVSMSVCDPGVF